MPNTTLSACLRTRTDRTFSFKEILAGRIVIWMASAFVMWMSMAWWLPSPLDAATFAGMDDGTRNRFLESGPPELGSTLTINPDFPLDESAISGIAVDSQDPDNFTNRSGVLITPRHYVAANHFNSSAPWFRGSDGVVRQYETVASTLLTTDFMFEGELMTGNSDIRIWTLDDSVALPGAHGVMPLPILSGPQGGFFGREIHAGDQFNQFGRNIIDEIGLATFGTTDDVPNQPTFAIVYDLDLVGTPGSVGGDEIFLQGGDSGNAALAVVDGQVALVGNHFGVDGTEIPPISVSTWLSPYVDQINAYTSAQAGGYTVSTVMVVPEPASGGILFLASAVCILRRSRQSMIPLVSSL